MTTLTEILNGVAGTVGLWPGAVEQALLYWPGAIAAAATVLVCMTAAFLILDAARRTAVMPGWSYLQTTIGALTAERDSTRCMVDSLTGERDSLRDDVELLKQEQARLASLRREREEEEKAFADVTQRLKRMAHDRKKVDTLRAELEKLQAEQASLTQSVIGLREEQNEHQTALDRRHARLNELEDEVIKSKAARDALLGEVAQRRLECDSFQRQAQQYKTALDDTKKMLRDAEDKLKEVAKDRDRMHGEMRAVEGRIGQLETQRREIDDKIAFAQAARTKVAQENGRLEADRSTLWVEFLALQEKRNTANADLAIIETKVRDLRHQRDALHGEIEMLRRVSASMPAPAA